MSKYNDKTYLNELNELVAKVVKKSMELNVSLIVALDNGLQIKTFSNEIEFTLKISTTSKCYSNKMVICPIFYSH